MELSVYQARANHMLKARGILLLLFSTTTLSLAQDRTANPDDVVTIDGLIDAYYESVSGHPGKRDAERMQSLFIKGGNMGINRTGDEPVHQFVEELLLTDRFLTISNDFFERELSRDTQQFGDMANVISTYGISDAIENTNYSARGVMVFQLIRHNDRWWIVSTMFQRESPEFPLTADLLD